MVKRLASIALLTGAAHVFTLITLKFLSQKISTDKISIIGELDSLFQFIINILAFGLQLSAVRNIAIADNWKSTYNQVQVARITLACLLVPFGILGLFNPSYQYLVLGPLFALSGDYALYGRGKPVVASVLAFFRVFIPSLVLIIFSELYKGFIISAYISATILIYGITSVFVAKKLETRYWYWPSLKNLQLYLQSFGLGIATMAYYTLGLGILIIAAYFYNTNVIAISYLGIKLYVIFKGVIRIINQAFVKEMNNDGIGIKVDQLAGFLGIGYAGIILIFPDSFIKTFFDESYISYKDFLTVTGIAGLVSSAFTSLTTRSLLKQKDKLYAVYSIISASVCILSVIIFSYFISSPFAIAMSLLIGEVLMTLGLIIINKGITIIGRLRFLLQAAALLLLPISMRALMGDSYLAMITGMLLYAGVGVAIYYKKINFPAFKETW